MKKSILWKICGLGSLLLLVFIVVSCSKKRLYPPAYFYTDTKTIELCEAISNADEKKITQLLQKGADINKVGKDGMTPLLWAFKCALKTKKQKIYEMVLKKGGNPNIVITGSGLKNKSVMYLVCMMDDSEYLEITLKYAKFKKDERVSVKDLINAIDASNSSLKKVKMLVASGVDINKAYYGDVPIIFAAHLNQWHIVYYLLCAGADPKIKGNNSFDLAQIIEESNELMSRKGFRYKYLRKCAKFLKDKGIKVDDSKSQKYPEAGIKQFYEE